ncbi:MAG: hypothetical protein BWY19_00900 [bacterium ADurb.Bin212]|nr:MAG: hypothetical protein BWY19_00900 [bacterium ADurb.Bin212]
MDKLSDFLNSSLNNKGLSGATGGAVVCFWADEWGKGRFKPISYFRGVLKVSVDSASAAQELQMESHKLIKHLNLIAAQNNGPKVREIRIVNIE